MKSGSFARNRRCGRGVLWGAVGLAFLGGCAVGPDYAPPETVMPQSWEPEPGTTLTSGPADLASWWRVFEDPVLSELILRAAQGNRSLQIAVARIQEAQALRGVAKSGFLPQLDAVGVAQYTRASEATTPVLPAGVDRETGYYSLGLAAGWELDVWGRVRRATESAQAGFEASVEDYRDTLVILYAAVAADYIEARTLQERIQYAQQNAAAQTKTLELTRNLNRAGLVGDLDVSQARLNVARTESIIPTLRSRLAEVVNRLTVLIGEQPGALRDTFAENEAIPVPPAAVATGLPADLLRQRPDIRRAERQLAAQTARIGVATADLYPQLSLPGTLQLEAFDVNNLDGRSVAYAFGPTLRWNLFTGGRVRNQIRIEESRAEQALLAYEETVLRALGEAESTLAAFAHEQDRLASVGRARDAARLSVRLVMDQYRSGLTQFQNVLDMERSLAVEEDNLAASRGLLAVNLVRIYRSLGGGWQPSTAPPITARRSAASSNNFAQDP